MTLSYDDYYNIETNNLLQVPKNFYWLNSEFSCQQIAD